MTNPGLPLLSLLLLTLPAGAALIWLMPDPRRARWIALGATLIDLMLAIAVVVQLDPTQGGFQLVEHRDWIPTLNIHYRVGVDGISVLFLPLTALLFIGVILASWTSSRTMQRLYYTLLLLLQSATIGVFCALDTFLFFMFWELTLIPVYFLVSLWGIGPNRRYAAVKYTLVMLVGGVPLLFAFLVLAFNHADLSGIDIPAGLAFDYPTLLQTPLPRDLEITVFFLLLLGFAVKTPLFPMHTWLPVIATDGPVAIAALMTGLKLGAFGLIRFVVPLTPDASSEFHWLLAALGVIGILYGGLAALAQTNLRSMLAFSSVSHVGLVVLGIASMNLQGLQGAVFQLLNFTVVAGGLFLLTGFLHHRIGSTEIADLGGAAHSLPLLASFFFLFGLASMGVPGTSGFPAEFLLIISALKSHTGAGLAALVGMIIGSTYFIAIYRRVFFGPMRREAVADALDLRRRELLVAVALSAVVLVAGLYPQGILDLTRSAGEEWIARLPAGD